MTSTRLTAILIFLEKNIYFTTIFQYLCYTLCIGEKCMKKLLTFICALLVLPCAFLLTACGGDPPHTHNWSTEYSSDYNYHWLTCDGCNEVKDKNSHDGDICSVCGFDKSHTCSYGSDYLSDSTGHWQQCSICGEPTTKENHSGNICLVCGYNSLEVVTSIRDLEIIAYQTDDGAVFTLVKLPDGKNMLIDAGSTKRSDISAVEDAIYDGKGGNITLDYMVLTNTFAKRSGGAETILTEMQVNNLYVPDTTEISYTPSEAFVNAVNYANTINTCNVIKLNPTSEDGYDVTSNYTKGAEKTLEISKANGIEIAILKSKSPSCSNSQIYDGTFKHNIIDGKGITVRLLEKNSIKVINENELEKL